MAAIDRASGPHRSGGGFDGGAGDDSPSSGLCGPGRHAAGHRALHLLDPGAVGRAVWQRQPPVSGAGCAYVRADWCLAHRHGRTRLCRMGGSGGVVVAIVRGHSVAAGAGPLRLVDQSGQCPGDDGFHPGCVFAHHGVASARFARRQSLELGCPKLASLAQRLASVVWAGQFGGVAAAAPLQAALARHHDRDGRGLGRGLCHRLPGPRRGGGFVALGSAGFLLAPMAWAGHDQPAVGACLGDRVGELFGDGVQCPHRMPPRRQALG